MLGDVEGKVTVWWIDDDSGSRQSDRRQLEQQGEEELKLIAIHPAEIESYLTKIPDRGPPDLLLIDFRLNSVPHHEKETPFYARDGATLRATTLRDPHLKDIPAYLVSQVAGEEQIGSSDDHIDWVLSHDHLMEQCGGQFLVSDAKDHRAIRQELAAYSGGDDPQEFRRSLVTMVRKLLRVPDASLESTAEAIDHMVGVMLNRQANLDSDKLQLSPSQPRAIARWIRTTLHRNRGPLIDDIAAATMIGSKEEYFKSSIRLELNLDAVEYTGVFQSTAKMNLWRQDLLQWLLSQDPSIEVSPRPSLAKSAAKYFCVPEDQWSTCRVCGELWPEAIAFDEDHPEVERAVHWRCSDEATDVDGGFGLDFPRSFAS